jgi:hypothetical protein
LQGARDGMQEKEEIKIQREKGSREREFREKRGIDEDRGESELSCRITLAFN